MSQLTISNLASPNSDGDPADVSSAKERADTQPVEPIFARHETFHPRFGWLKKGFDLVKKDPNIFQKDDAPVQLGVGKNMVRSIRFLLYRKDIFR
jgi:hypothetical protein